MRFNEKELKQLAVMHPIVQGTLQYMKPQNKDWSDWYQQPVYKERIFKLVHNFLFYYRTNEQEEPLGAFVLEHMEVAYESPGPAFAFSITYNDGKHIFGCRCQEDLNKWVAALKVASYSYWRSLHEVLQVKLDRHKGWMSKSHNISSSRQFEATTTTSNNDNNAITMITKKMSKSTFYSQSQSVSSSTRIEDATQIKSVPVENLIDL